MTRYRYNPKTREFNEIKPQGPREPICPGIHVKGDVHFESRQLPKWSKHHQGEFSADGKPQFTSRYEANEYAKRVSGEEDTECAYGEMD